MTYSSMVENQMKDTPPRQVLITSTSAVHGDEWDRDDITHDDITVQSIVMNGTGMTSDNEYQYRTW